MDSVLSPGGPSHPVEAVWVYGGKTPNSSHLPHLSCREIEKKRPLQMYVNWGLECHIPPES